MEKKNKLWFRAKDYGWGWYPITWQGWVIIIIYCAGIIKIAIRAVNITRAAENNASAFLWNYIPPLIFISVVLIWICYKKGEKPEWRWAGKKIWHK